MFSFTSPYGRMWLQNRGVSLRLSAAGLPPEWNVAPTKTVYALLERRRPDDLDARPVRRLRPVRWGLVPSWARDRTPRRVTA